MACGKRTHSDWTRSHPQLGASLVVPGLIARAGKKASKRFLEFFVAQYRSKNTREAYARAVGRFRDWCEDQGLAKLDCLEPLHVAAYFEGLTHCYKVRTVKQHLAAVRMCFDCHADERTTGLYDRSADKMTKEEVERMRFTRVGQKCPKTKAGS